MSNEPRIGHPLPRASEAVLDPAIRRPLRSHELPTWEVLVPVTGLNDRVLLVLTAWKIVAGIPELVTARVAHKRLQPGAPRATLDP